ncbi:Steroid 5-alpha reductase family enzyme [Fontimonas thermophila]|uniref:Steroid 5-alpha reductase family enzyme n=1 Tax=Fontimonas thermophila TaxID=1076937 RepID=A0A1I2IB55_9GAMM|nr:DUF1295 domain-containing protein [Fontimonas thermophila]SFF39525.1 Steroid 5-alpha reductase family enzyme [Fontimonas thermophila]
MNPLAAVVLHLAVAVSGVIAVWFVQRRSRNASIIDAVWPLLVGAGALVYALCGDGDPAVRLALATVAMLWALRLGSYLAWRNAGRHEERRYAELRSRWGANADRRMLGFFLLQAVVAWIMGLSFLAAAYRPSPLDALWLYLGVVIGLVGIAGEALADTQLAAFRRRPENHGRVCDVGLWAWSRHPNYFFECVHWAAYPFFAIGAPWGWSAAIGLVVIVLLLLKFSGIPTVEERAAASRRIGYDDYVRRTSAFIPWPPRRGRTS